MEMVYVADQPGGSNTGEALLEVPFTNGAYGAPVSIPVAGLAGIWDVALDQAGNIYAADFTKEQVFKLDVSDPPSLSFASTNVGSTSTDSPKTVAVTNIGNLQLYLNAANNNNNPAYPADFPINNSDNNLCQEDDSVSPGMSCDVSVNFKPTTPGNPLSENVVLTDNSNLNGAGVTQSISGSKRHRSVLIYPADDQLHPAHHAGHVFRWPDHSAGRHRRRFGGNPICSLPLISRSTMHGHHHRQHVERQQPRNLRHRCQPGRRIQPIPPRPRCSEPWSSIRSLSLRSCPTRLPLAARSTRPPVPHRL